MLCVALPEPDQNSFNVREYHREYRQIDSTVPCEAVAQWTVKRSFYQAGISAAITHWLKVETDAHVFGAEARAWTLIFFVETQELLVRKFFF